MPVIDFRVRPPFLGFNQLDLYRPRTADPDPVTLVAFAENREAAPSFEKRSIELFVSEMDSADIGWAVAMGRQAAVGGTVDNDDLLALTLAYPGRFVGFAGVSVKDIDAAVAEVDRCAGAGMRGISLEAPWNDPPMHHDDLSLAPVYEAAIRHGLVTALTSSIYVGPDLSYSNPVRIQRVANAYPTLKIVVPHASWPWSTQMCGVALKCPNIYLIPDFYGFLPGIPGAADYLLAANSYLSYRTLFASSYPVRPLGQSVRQFSELAWDSEEILERCLRANAERLLDGAPAGSTGR